MDATVRHQSAGIILMRVAYISDLHGSMKHYEAVLAAAHRCDCGAVIFGGDLAPKNFRDGKFVQHQVDWHRNTLFPLLEQFRLKRPRTRIFFIMGNDDSRAAEKLFADRDGDIIEYLHLKSAELEPGLLLSGYNCVDISPFPLKDFERWDKRSGILPAKMRLLNGVVTGEEMKLENFKFEDDPVLSVLPTLEEEMAPLAEKQKKGVSILVAHCPPIESSLDKMMLGKHVGSLAVREFIEKTQPALSLHGHIHESPAMTGSYRDEIGSTICVNPGQDPYKGIVHYVVFDTDNPGRTMEHFVEK